MFDRDGKVEPLKLPPGPYRSPRVSRDGRWVTFETADQKTTFISVFEIGGQSVARRLTFDANSRAPLWSVDGQWIVFTSVRDGGSALYRTRADGSATAEPLTKPEKGITHYAQSWSRDGQQLLFSAETGPDVTQSELRVLQMKDRTVTPFGVTSAREATISPDGRWVAYGTRATPGSGSVGNMAPGNQVFVEPFPRTQGKHFLPQPGGHPVWFPKSDALLTNSGQTQSHRTQVMTSPEFSFGQSVEFPRRGRNEANPVFGRRQVDVMPDGRVLGVISSGAQAAPSNVEIVVVLNWLDEVRQRVPRP